MLVLQNLVWLPRFDVASRAFCAGKVVLPTGVSARLDS